MERYMRHIIYSTEQRVEHFLKTQVTDEKSPFYGGMKQTILDGKPTVFAMADAAAVYLNPNSKFYRDDTLLRAMDLGISFIQRCQREDGSFDYPSCNFRSAPDTAFCFERLIETYRLFQKYATKTELTVLKAKYAAVLKATFPIFLNGGFHTPNHRWAITAALYQGAGMIEGQDFQMAKRMLARAGDYLKEGIDGNEDGEYAERSTGNYNAVVNSSMITLYEETGDLSYLGYVERNLRMMLFYIDPDDTIFTQNSTRQDRGKDIYADQYFYQYLYMADKTGNEIFDKAAHKIIKDNMERGEIAPDCLPGLMLRKSMISYTFNGYGFMETYHKYFSDSGVLRVCTPNFGYSILKGNSTFLYMKFHKVPIWMKIGESYCDIRNFIPETFEETQEGYIMTAKAQGWYYLPLDEKPDTSDWWKMDHSKRNRLISSSMEISVRVKEEQDGLYITVKSLGLDGLPLRVELGLPIDCILENESFYMKTKKGEGLILRKGIVYLHCEDETIAIGPGYGTHEFEGHYSGEERNSEGFTLSFNDYTPYERTFSIRRI